MGRRVQAQSVSRQDKLSRYWILVVMKLDTSPFAASYGKEET